MTPREHAAVTLHPATDTVVGFGVFRFDRGNGLLSRGGEELPLPPRALAVLSVLIERAGRVVGKHELLQAAWNGAFVTETSLSEAVSLLRQTLGDDPQRPEYIQTVHRRGYRFIAPLRVEALPGANDAPALRDSLPSRPAVLSAAPPSPAAEGAPVSAVQPSEAPATVRARPRPWALAIVGAALLLSVVAGAFLTGRRASDSPAAPPTRLGFAPPAGWKLVVYHPSLAVSPDGRRVVFAAFGDETTSGEKVRSLFVRDLGRPESEKIPNTDGARAPFFSPDGRTVGFFAEGQLRRVTLGGGPPSTIVPTPGEGGSWSEDGTIVFAAGKPTSIFRVPASGGAPKRLTRPDPRRGEVQHWWPQLLPGGDALLFTAWSTTLHDARVEWLSLRSGERRTVVVGGAAARYAAGQLLWARPDGTVVAAPFDPRGARLLGEATPLLANVVPHPFYGFAQLAVGGDTLVYLPGTSTPIGRRRLAWLDGKTERALPTPLRFYRNLKTGPRGLLAATLLARDRSDVWLVDPASGALSRLTFDAFNIEPTWSPDGKWVAYASNRQGPFNIYRRRADGSAPAERLLASARHQHPTSWSPDGRELMMGEVAPGTGFDLWVLDLATRRPRPLLRTPANEIYAEWSPDGRWFAYCSDESGRWEVFVRSHGDLAGRWQLSTDGGCDPFWAADGRTVYFHSDGNVWAVQLAPAGRELRPGPARRVTDREDLEIATSAPGGGIYAILEQRPYNVETPSEVQVVLGWQGMLPPG